MRSSVFKSFILLSTLVILVYPVKTFADTLFISPSSGNYTEGQAFSVRVAVSSTRQAINAVSGTLSFPSDLLQVTSISKGSSILTLWVQEPSYSNARGTVSFEGVVPNPGFSGSDGRVVTVNFRVIKSGTAKLSFSNGSLLANDGYGTNVLKNIGTANFNLSPKPVTTPTTIETKPEEVPQTESNFEEPAVEVIDFNQPQVSVDEEPQRKIEISIPSLSEIYNWFVKFMSLVIPLVAVGFALTHVTMHGVHKVRKTRQNLRRELQSIDHLVGKSFDLLREEISDDIRLLERARSKRELTKEEDKIIRSLRANLEQAERVIHKEFEEVEKHIEG